MCSVTRVYPYLSVGDPRPNSSLTTPLRHSNKNNVIEITLLGDLKIKPTFKLLGGDLCNEKCSSDIRNRWYIESFYAYFQNVLILLDYLEWMHKPLYQSIGHWSNESKVESTEMYRKRLFVENWTCMYLHTSDSEFLPTDQKVYVSDTCMDIERHTFIYLSTFIK